MSSDRFFLDTFFIQALLNRHDAYHEQARTFLPFVRDAMEVWTTEAILTEVGNALSTINRIGAITFIQQCYQTDNIQVVSVEGSLFEEAVKLYDSRRDKTWGLTDCISFVVMTQHGIIDAVTADRHFEQAGFRALLSEQK